MKRSALLFVLVTMFLSPPGKASAQAPAVIDSLLDKLKTASDTSRVNILNNLCWEYRSREPAKALDYGQQALQLATKLSFKGGLVRAYSRLGVIHMDQGRYPEAKIFFQHALEIGQETKNFTGVASSYMNLGNLHYYQGEYEPAIDNFLKASKIYEQIGDRQGVCNCMNNTGSVYFSLGNYAKALEYEFQVLNIYRELKLKQAEGMCLDNIGAIYSSQGNLTLSLQNHLAGLSILEQFQNKQQIAICYANIGGVYSDMNNYSKALEYYSNSLKLNQQLENKRGEAEDLHNMGNIYIRMDKLSEAMDLYQKTLAIANKINATDDVALAEAGMASVFNRQGNFSKALEYYNKALVVNRKQKNLEAITDILQNMTYVYDNAGQHNKALEAGLECLEIAKKTGSLSRIKDADFALSSVYKNQKKYDKALQYFEDASKLKDTILNEAKSREIGRLESGFELDKKDQQITLLNKDKIIQASKSQRQALIRNALIAGFVLILILASVLIRNNRHKQRTNLLLTGQKKEIESKRDSLEEALVNLKATQSQLVQREKMASLGELTAGIAHEIQNPLNFVNNFSEVNTELIAELEEEQKKIPRDLQIEKEILGDIKQNLEKINHHGKRADSIVKGMLQHSRSSAGQKEPTDINALADEFLRLSYHGLRAKDKSFNATIHTDFDESIGKINVIPQDIGRVLLNLCNNAFYAVKPVASEGELNTPAKKYEPTVWLSTKKISPGATAGLGDIEIRIKDNGVGIPQKVLDKIFQPFFTTKPTGEGTGLGLSLSYDIIKAHGGQLNVETKEGEGSEFIIHLPYRA